MGSTHADNRVLLMGAPGSPYTRKMIALLRYRRIPHAVRWGGHHQADPALLQPKVRLLPTFYFPDGEDGLEAVVDSTPIVRRLEAEHAGRFVIPHDPVMAFLNHFIEDYADEWLTKAMFHFRWAHAADIANAGPMLVFWSDPTMPDGIAANASKMISQRQIDRLYVVGSNAVTAPTIEDSYARLLVALDGLIQRKGYVLGARPSSADFALYGQLTQLAIIEPTSAAVTTRHSMRTRAWLDRVEDLSGLDPRDEHWLDRTEARDVLGALLGEIGRVYAPFLLANAAAVARNDADFTAEIDGRPWTQPTFPYQAKCLAWIREAFAGLSAQDAAATHAVLQDTGCETLLA